MKNKLSGISTLAKTLALFVVMSAATNKALTQNLASNGKNKAQTEVTAKINKLTIDPFDRVKTFIDQSNPVEVEHYNRLLETELKQKESHILGLKVALLALHNDPTISAEDKKALALFLFEDLVNLPKGTPNREFYAEKYMDRLENDENFVNLCIKFGEMQGNLMAEIAEQRSLELLARREQLDEKGKQLDEKGKQLDEEIAKGKEEIAKGKERGKQLDKEIALLEQILKTFQDANK